MSGTPFMLVVAGLALFWVGMLGLLWRRSLVGMLVGVLFGWISVVVSGTGFALAHSGAAAARGEAIGGALLVLCAALVCALQVALGLSIVVARVTRRGSLDAEDAGLLEG